MAKYRILKKINYKFHDNLYPEAYIIQVKKFLTWVNLGWWSGTDISDKDFWKSHMRKLDGSKRPCPCSETSNKYGSNCYRGAYGNMIFFFEEEPAKFFLSKVIELDQYFYDVQQECKNKKEKSVDVIYIEDKKEERKLQIVML